MADKISSLKRAPAIIDAISRFKSNKNTVIEKQVKIMEYVQPMVAHKIILF